MFEANQLSLAIWLPIVGAIAVLATGNDQRAALARIVALLVSIVTFLVTIPLYTALIKLQVSCSSSSICRGSLH